MRGCVLRGDFVVEDDLRDAGVREVQPLDLRLFGWRRQADLVEVQVDGRYLTCRVDP